eukprot:TRINITY_DN4186_c0_g3_i1.p2 TRINITY_DN4186_c0_g3~~TRINITY_DN4186_c0_g3_i1.p2  ORF type:complete len:165 (-),score=32.38 TRINITY_DN4186_c0_g3_i1:65-559(-)
MLNKLCIEVGNRYSGIVNFYKTINGFPADNFSPAVRAYAAYNEVLWGCVYLKYLGIMAYKNAKYGEAVVILRKAMRDLTTEPSRVETQLTPFINKYKEERLYIEKIGKILIYDNEKVYYDPLPPESTLQLGGEGKLVIKTIEFTPPTAVPIELTFLDNSSCVVC